MKISAAASDKAANLFLVSDNLLVILVTPLNIFLAIFSLLESFCICFMALIYHVKIKRTLKTKNILQNKKFQQTGPFLPVVLAAHTKTGRTLWVNLQTRPAGLNGANLQPKCYAPSSLVWSHARPKASPDLSAEILYFVSAASAEVAQNCYKMAAELFKICFYTVLGSQFRTISAGEDETAN